MRSSSEEEEKPTKSEKCVSSPPPAPDINNYHIYPDWATVQAFYGPRLAVPPYMTSAVASSPAASAYMWAPAQSMVPHYGAPYAAFYAHYAHPGVPLAGTPPGTESPIKLSDGGDDQKKLGGIAMSIVDGNVDSNEPVAERRLSDSEATDGSSDGSSNGEVAKSVRKRSRQDKCKPIPAAEASDKSRDGIPSGDSQGTNKLENIIKSSPTHQQIPSDVWLQKERELKRERRKQSNRESARRSRLRKQAETEELANKVQALASDNMNLKSEINKLMENSAKLELENAALMKKVTEGNKGKATVNLLARVDCCNGDGEAATYDTRSRSRSSPPPPTPNKLHQLLDGVAAS